MPKKKKKNTFDTIANFNENVANSFLCKKDNASSRNNVTMIFLYLLHTSYYPSYTLKTIPNPHFVSSLSEVTSFMNDPLVEFRSIIASFDSSLEAGKGNEPRKIFKDERASSFFKNFPRASNDSWETLFY